MRFGPRSSLASTALRRCLAAVVLGLPLVFGTAAAQSDVATKVDAIFAEWDKPTSPGCALGVVQDGELIYTRGYGTADLERGVPITPETVFYLGSVSKQFTAANVALLAQRGDISLDDDVRKHVPELSEYGQPVTIRHLIHHMSGVRDYYDLLSLAGVSWQAFGAEATLALIAQQENLNFPPGEEYLYSNSGYFLLPVIVERVTGQSIRQFAQEHLFGPLGMEHTSFHDDHTIPVPNRAYSYGTKEEGAFELTFLPEFDLVGAGGVLSTIYDLVRWDQNFYDAKAGGKEFVGQLHTRGVLNNGDTLSYAFGLTISEYKGLRTVSHGGSLMGFRTQLTRYPDQRFSVICLCNLGNINPGLLARKVAEIYLADLFEANLSEYAGAYYSKELDVTWTVRLTGGNLAFAWKDNLRVSQPAQERDSFRFGGTAVKFIREQGERISGFEVDAGRARGVSFVRRER